MAEFGPFQPYWVFHGAKNWAVTKLTSGVSHIEIALPTDKGKTLKWRRPGKTRSRKVPMWRWDKCVRMLPDDGRPPAEIIRELTEHRE